ncbi:MAG: NAD(P)-binding protein [Bacteroidota bacterium]
MNKYDVVIIGGGLGGLLCGNILSREGYNVCIVEKNKKTGGCLQVFAREKCIFNTGLNYTEGLAEGQILNRYFRYFGIMDKLKLKRMDMDGFEVINFRDKEYRFAQGEENFIETLTEEFPAEKKGINNYLWKLKDLCNQFPLYNLELKRQNPDYTNLYRESAFEYIQSVTKNEILQNVLAGNNMLYAGVAEKTPLYIHSLITYSLISSSWRLVDGSAQMVSLLTETIKKNGGDIIPEANVKKIEVENGSAKYVFLENGEVVEGRNFISNIHPQNTLQLIDDAYFTKAFRERVKQTENSISFFSLYVVLKENALPYRNYNNYVYNDSSVWVASIFDKNKWPQSFMMYTPASSKGLNFADGLIVLTYMSYEEVKKWENTFVENRGSDYIEFKKQKAEKLLDAVEKKIPGIRNKIKNYYTSTPLTYRDYTGTPQGSAYGMMKDYNNPLKTLIMPRTKIPNLFFTGQNLNVHGILGVTIGAVMTCGELLGLNYLVDRIRKN